MHKKYIGIIGLLCSSVLLSATLAACGNDTVAATVDGLSIDEAAIDAKVDDMRMSMGLTDDGAWNTWLENAGTSAEQLRSDVLDTLVDEGLKLTHASELGISVDEDTVQQLFDDMVARFDGDEALWKQYLSNMGIEDDAAYKKYLHDMLTVQEVDKYFMSAADDAAEGAEAEQEWLLKLRAEADINVKVLE